ncbi:MAG TPA: rod shape-determining protein MreC [Acidimicrobiales bacterium]|nr:rod shape-determining protein MreC [Acidimicrobiales bacterium]
MAVLVLAAITLVTLDARSGGSGFLGSVRSDTRAVIDPVENGAHSVLQPVGNFLTGAADYGSLKQENQRLRNEVASMEATQAQVQATEAQAAEVLGQAHLDFAANVPDVAAQVIDQGAANLESGFEINRGTGAGIAVGYPVVTAGGLIGTVTAATRTHATVTVLTDPTFNVGVAVPHTPAVGAASGYGPGAPLRVADIAKGTPLTKGEVLSTSGLQGEKFPPGIPVGRVASVSTPSGALQEMVTLSPLVDPGRVSAIAVLVWSSQTPAG